MPGKVVVMSNLSAVARIANARILGTVIKRNAKTILLRVSLPSRHWLDKHIPPMYRNSASGDFVTKRHIEKHKVVFC